MNAAVQRAVQRLHAVCLLCLPCLVLPLAKACPLPAPALQQGPVQARWQIDGPPIAVGRHFVMLVQLCPASATLAKVDATMPAHRHGMNYKPSIQALGPGRWRVEGLLFHMPGQWALRLDVQADGNTVSLHDTITLK